MWVIWALNVITASIKKSPKQQKIAQSGHTELIVIILYTLVTITIKVYVATFFDLNLLSAKNPSLPTMKGLAECKHF